MTAQQKWNRYVYAINYCISQGILISMEDSKGGNVKCIRARWYDLHRNANNYKEAIIYLKPKKYKPLELYAMIIEQIGFPNK